MNYFFGFSKNFFYSNLTIPKFTNYNNISPSINLYTAFIKNNKWYFDEVNCKQDKDFFYVGPELINNNNFFFLANNKEFKKQTEQNLLLDINNHTNTNPEFRCNLEINKINGGFSSYQSEYSHPMTKVKGALVTSLSLLTMKKCQNYLIFKNIYHEPKIEKFFGYVVNMKLKKVLAKIDLYSNTANIIEIKHDWIDKEIYFCTKEYTGIPIFLLDSLEHLSFEHTHPPSTYILGSDRHKYVKIFKNKILSILD